MDYIFISKVLIIFFFYILINYIYKNTDWNFRGKKEIWTNPKAQKFHDKLKRNFKIGLNDFLIWSSVPFGIAAFFSIVVILFWTIQIFNFILEKSYIEQVIFYVGIIGIYFGLKIKSESKKFDKEQKDELIKKYKNEIWELKRNLSNYKRINKNTELNKEVNLDEVAEFIKKTWLNNEQ
jgi:hypothetical protein